MHGVARRAALVLVAALLLAPAARAATPEASTTDRLQDRREVASGDRAYVEGFQDGRLTVTVASRHPRGAGQRTGS